MDDSTEFQGHAGGVATVAERSMTADRQGAAHAPKSYLQQIGHDVLDQGRKGFGVNRLRNKAVGAQLHAVDARHHDIGEHAIGGVAANIDVVPWRK